MTEITVEERVLSTIGILEATLTELRRCKRVLLAYQTGSLPENQDQGAAVAGAAAKVSEVAQAAAVVAEQLTNMIQPRLNFSGDGEE